jgi:hypothetical protein
MPNAPETAENLERIRKNFAGRRGIGNCVMAVDGTHIPYTPRYRQTAEDYKNYKGFHSILALCFVNSFYLFVDADVGFPGRAADNTVLARSDMMEAIKQDPDKWLGQGGCIAAAASGGEKHDVGTPFPPHRTSEITLRAIVDAKPHVAGMHVVALRHWLLDLAQAQPMHAIAAAHMFGSFDPILH